MFTDLKSSLMQTDVKLTPLSAWEHRTSGMSRQHVTVARPV